MIRKYNKKPQAIKTEGDLVGFTSISSEIYPELQTHYSEVFSEWAKADAKSLCHEFYK